MITAGTFDKADAIPAERQEEILRKASERRWNEIRQTVANGGLSDFLDNMAAFCMEQTRQPTSSYASVTGIGMSSRDLEALRNREPGSNPAHDGLARVLSTCFAHNILEPLPDAKQGQRGTTHLVFYMNRLLCLRYKLPLPYGGWREMPIDSLCELLAKSPEGRRGAEPLQRELEASA